MTKMTYFVKGQVVFDIEGRLTFSTLEWFLLCMTLVMSSQFLQGGKYFQTGVHITDKLIWSWWCTCGALSWEQHSNHWCVHFQSLIVLNTGDNCKNIYI